MPHNLLSSPGRESVEVLISELGPISYKSSESWQDNNWEESGRGVAFLPPLQSNISKAEQRAAHPRLLPSYTYSNFKGRGKSIGPGGRPQTTQVTLGKSQNSSVPCICSTKTINPVLPALTGCEEKLWENTLKRI